MLFRSEMLKRVEPDILELLGRVQGVQQKIGISVKELKDINKQMSTGEAKARRAKRETSPIRPASSGGRGGSRP